MEKLEFISTFKGRIIHALAPRGGVSQRSGNSWKVQSFVLEECGVQYPQQIIFEVFGEDKLQKFDIQEGLEYEVNVSFKTEEYNGNHYQKIRAWNVTRLDVPKEQFAVPATPTNIVPTPQVPQGQAEETTDPFAPDEGEEDSGLPF